MPQEDRETTSTQALRLMLTYRDGTVVLDDVVPVVKRLPPSDPLPETSAERPLSGFWYELRDRNGEVLYRQIEPNPIINAWIEPVDRDGRDSAGIRRIAAVPRMKAFTLLVPDRADGDHVLLVSSPLDEPGIARPAEPRWRIPLPDRQEGGDRDG